MFLLHNCYMLCVGYTITHFRQVTTTSLAQAMGNVVIYAIVVWRERTKIRLSLS